ncbi:MAG: M48 family metallopeptidase [bacterium]|nr:M48 family metallopeptidase [bacterium]
MHIAETELHKIIENLTKKLTKKTDLSLKDITKKLNKKYFNNKLIINSIEYSAKQKKRFGSCQTLTARILISERLKKVPKWVLEYVIFHEMAHLIEPNHGQNFKKITAKFPLEERAKGFLLAMSYELYDE